MALHHFDVDGLDLVLIDVLPLAPPAEIDLSAGEREIISLLCQGLSTTEIAARRKASNKTVSNQLGRIYRKFDVMSRYELVAKLASCT